LGYAGYVCLRHHHPKEFPEEAMEEEKVILANFSAALEADPSNDSTSDDREAELDTSEEELDATRAEYERTNVYRITEPLAKESVEAVVKALNYLWEVQTEDKENPNRFPKLRQCVSVMRTRDAYLRRLVHDTAAPCPDRGVYCSQGDGYSVQDFLRMMVVLWKGFDTWDKRQSLLRDRMAINLRHQTFLRDENLRMMSLSDCFRESLRTSFNGTVTKISGAFALDGFKDRPYRLLRDCYLNLFELQRLVFAWIEDQCPESDRAVWRKKCDKIMEDTPESSTSVIREIYDKIVKEEEEENNEEKLPQGGTSMATAPCGQCSSEKGKWGPTSRT
ncbi:hypothetical protein BG004_001941, partial [Podila humilis]